MITPLIPTDVGRSFSKRPRQRADCTVKALALCLGVSYDAAYDILAKGGRKCSRPFELFEWVRHGAYGLPSGRRFRRYSFPSLKGNKRVTVSDFHEHLPRDPHRAFIVGVTGHVFAYMGGRRYDEFVLDPKTIVTVVLEVVKVPEGYERYLASTYKGDRQGRFYRRRLGVVDGASEASAYCNASREWEHLIQPREDLYLERIEP